jgi:hypothetical protein
VTARERKADVGQDGYAVRGEGDIGFESPGSEGQGTGEGGKGVRVGSSGGGAAVGEADDGGDGGVLWWGRGLWR